MKIWVHSSPVARLDDHLHPLGSVARSGQSIPSTAPPDPSRSGTIPYGSACACRRTRRRRRSSASWKNSAGGIGVFHQIREVFFRPSLSSQRTLCLSSVYERCWVFAASMVPCPLHCMQFPRCAVGAAK